MFATKRLCANINHRYVRFKIMQKHKSITLGKAEHICTIHTLHYQLHEPKHCIHFQSQPLARIVSTPLYDMLL